jgi:hypothetical protein
MNNYALIENDIIVNIVVANSVDDIRESGIWAPVSNTLNIGDNYIDYLRQQAYEKEADPLFFKWQRGEATEQEWSDKVAEIKAKYGRSVV